MTIEAKGGDPAELQIKFGAIFGNVFVADV